jgi:hypothetical protein
MFKLLLDRGLKRGAARALKPLIYSTLKRSDSKDKRFSLTRL